MRYFSFVVRIVKAVDPGMGMGIRIPLVTQIRMQMQIRIQVSKIMRINADPGPLPESYFSNFSNQFIEKSIKLPRAPVLKYYIYLGICLVSSLKNTRYCMCFLGSISKYSVYQRKLN
jgi:hypothetical protein